MSTNSLKRSRDEEQDLVTHSKKSKINVEEDFTCGICLELLYEPCTLVCGHNFCLSCLIEASEQNNDCPGCRKKYIKTSISKNIFLENLMNQFPEYYDHYQKVLVKRKIQEIKDQFFESNLFQFLKGEIENKFNDQDNILYQCLEDLNRGLCQNDPDLWQFAILVILKKLNTPTTDDKTLSHPEILVFQNQLIVKKKLNHYLENHPNLTNDELMFLDQQAYPKFIAWDLIKYYQFPEDNSCYNIVTQEYQKVESDLEKFEALQKLVTLYQSESKI